MPARHLTDNGHQYSTCLSGVGAVVSSVIVADRRCHRPSLSRRRNSSCSRTRLRVSARATAACIDYAICIVTFISAIIAFLQLQVTFGVASSRDSSGA